MDSLFSTDQIEGALEAIDGLTLSARGALSKPKGVAKQVDDAGCSLSVRRASVTTSC
jgi:hypothetical protein